MIIQEFKISIRSLWSQEAPGRQAHLGERASLWAWKERSLQVFSLSGFYRIYSISLFLVIQWDLYCTQSSYFSFFIILSLFSILRTSIYGASLHPRHRAESDLVLAFKPLWSSRGAESWTQLMWCDCVLTCQTVPSRGQVPITANVHWVLPVSGTY